MNSLIYLIENSELIKYITNIDMLCIIISTLGHDVAHPAVTNRFLINSKGDLAIKYND